MDTECRLVCLWYGDVGREEFRPVSDWLRRNYQVCEVLPPATEPGLHDPAGCAGQEADSSSHVLRRGQSIEPSLLVVAQSHPGQVTTALLVQLRGCWPQAQLVVLQGDWCRGPADKDLADAEILKLPAGSWSGGVPGLDGDGRRLPCEGQVGASREPAGCVLLACRDLTLADGLAHALSACGWTCCWVPAGQPLLVQGPLSIVWQAPSDDQQRAVELLEWRQRHPHARLIALVDFPRHAELRRLLRSGADAVLGTPVDLVKLNVALRS